MKRQQAGRTRLSLTVRLLMKEKLKILGVYICSYKCASHIDKNWSERIAKIKRLISLWERKNVKPLSVAEKCLLKIFLISQVVYVMQTLVVPEKVLIEINRLLFRCLWRKKDYNRRAFEKVNRSVLCTDVESGGLNMTDLKDMQVAFLLQCFLQVCKAKNPDKWSLTP